MIVDYDYFNNSYGGIEIPENIFENLSKRAENDINRLLKREIDPDSLDVQILYRVKNAICSQIEFLFVKGETSSVVAGSNSSFSIGSYSESTGSKYGASNNTVSNRYADSVQEWLAMTGLLYKGVPYI